jgi:Zn-dependent protease
MFSELINNPLAAITILGSLVIAVTIHEYAHAYVADRLGDPTPRLMGRVSLNPLVHLDLIGSITMILVGFGWGKPVPFDPFNLQRPRQDAALISIAGPASNVILAISASLLARLFNLQDLALQLTIILVYINLVLAFFNLVPIHPLDGFKIVHGLLSKEQARAWARSKSYGIYLLILILLPLRSGNSSLVHTFLSPPLDFMLKLLLG